MLFYLSYHLRKILIICILMSSLLYAGAPDTLWTRRYGRVHDSIGYKDMGNSIQQTSDGGFVIAGYSSPFMAGRSDVYLIRIDSTGDTLWTSTYGEEDADEWGESVLQTIDGGFIIAGTKFPTSQYDVYLVRTDSKGDTLWTKTIKGISHELARSIQHTDDSGFIIAGRATSSTGGGDEFYLIRTDSDGDTLWTKTYGGDGRDECFSVRRTSDGSFILSGWTDSFDMGMRDVYLIRTDLNGNTLWARTYGGAKGEYSRSVNLTSDGGFIMAGYNSDRRGIPDTYVIRTDSTGDTLWTRTYGVVEQDIGNSVQQTSDGGFIISGHIGYSLSDPNFIYLIRTDPDGDTLWTKTLEKGRDGNSVLQTSDNSFIVVGSTRSFGDTLGDVYIVRLCKETTGIKKPACGQQLMVNKIKNIKRVEIYDLLGRKIKTLPAGAFVNYKVLNGVYVVRLIGKDFSRQIKTVITK